MPDTLPELTLQYSRDLSALQVECRRRLDDVERDRHDALYALVAARPALLQFETARANAGTLRDNALDQARAIFEAAQLGAGNARADELLEVQQRYLAVDRAAADAKTAALRKADAAYNVRLEEIDRTVPLDKQFAAREKAFEARNQAGIAIEATWRDTLQADRDKQQAELQSALDEERRKGEQASDRRDAARKAADVVYEQTLELAQTRLTNALTAVPEAAGLQAEHDQRRATIQQDCRVREEQLLDAFRDALKRTDG